MSAEELQLFFLIPAVRKTMPMALRGGFVEGSSVTIYCDLALSFFPFRRLDGWRDSLVRDNLDPDLALLILGPAFSLKEEQLPI